MEPHDVGQEDCATLLNVGQEGSVDVAMPETWWLHWQHSPGGEMVVYRRWGGGGDDGHPL